MTLQEQAVMERVAAERGLYGLLAEFRDTETLVRAAARTREAGYRRFNAYTPFPVHGLAEAVGFRRTGLPLVVLGGGIFGCLGGFALQYWVSVIAYPVNVGGRPLNSWVSFIPVTFETTVLCAALAAVLGMLALNGLPRPHHPLFGVPAFDRVTRDKFFLCIEAADERFDADETRRFLTGLEASEVIDVPL
ncbi:MAG: DUF3341 domain-containing protein [Planctomycetales bacterium]